MRSVALPRLYRKRICREKALPAGKTARRRRNPRGDIVPGLEACSPTVLSLAEAELVAAYRANAIFDAHREDPSLGIVCSLMRPKLLGRP